MLQKDIEQAAQIASSVQPLPVIQDADIAKHLKDEQWGSAEFYARLVENDLCYHTTKKLWLRYSGGRWVEDDKDFSMWEMTQTLLSHYTRVASHEPDEKLAKMMFQMCGKHKSFSYQKGIEGFLRQRLGKSASEFDNEPHLLNLRNGTFNLKTMRLQKHNPKDWLMQQANVVYDPNATCPEWTNFMKLVFEPTPDVLGYIQSWVGTTLSGYVDADKMAFNYGGGSNGKGTFWMTLQGILGSYAITINPELVLIGRLNKEQELAKLKGKRLAVVHDIAPGRRLDEGMIKVLIGGDEIVARELYQNSSTFKPSHKLAVCANDRPTVRGTDTGIWRRIALIPFEQDFSYLARMGKLILKDRDAFRTQLIENEGSGILNWMITGWQRYCTEGLKAPDVIERETRAYRAENDVLGAFLHETIAERASEKVLVKDLYARYTEYCKSGNEHAVSNKAFVAELRKLKYDIREGHARKLYLYGYDFVENGGSW